MRPLCPVPRGQDAWPRETGGHSEKDEIVERREGPPTMGGSPEVPGKRIPARPSFQEDFNGRRSLELLRDGQFSRAAEALLSD